MATINTAHHESGGVVLFQGELILLFCENVNLNIVEKRENVSIFFLSNSKIMFDVFFLKGNWQTLSHNASNDFYKFFI